MESNMNGFLAEDAGVWYNPNAEYQDGNWANTNAESWNLGTNAQVNPQQAELDAAMAVVQCLMFNPDGADTFGIEPTTFIAQPNYTEQTEQPDTYMTTASVPEEAQYDWQTNQWITSTVPTHVNPQEEQVCLEQGTVVQAPIEPSLDQAPVVRRGKNKHVDTESCHRDLEEPCQEVVTQAKPKVKIVKNIQIEFCPTSSSVAKPKTKKATRMEKTEEQTDEVLSTVTCKSTVSVAPTHKTVYVTDENMNSYFEEDCRAKFTLYATDPEDKTITDPKKQYKVGLEHGTNHELSRHGALDVPHNLQNKFKRVVTDAQALAINSFVGYFLRYMMHKLSLKVGSLDYIHILIHNGYKNHQSRQGMFSYNLLIR